MTFNWSLKGIAGIHLWWDGRVLVKGDSGQKYSLVDEIHGVELAKDLDGVIVDKAAYTRGSSIKGEIKCKINASMTPNVRSIVRVLDCESRVPGKKEWEWKLTTGDMDGIMDEIETKMSKLVEDKDGSLFPDLTTKHAAEILVMMRNNGDEFKRNYIENRDMGKSYLYDEESKIQWANTFDRMFDPDVKYEVRTAHDAISSVKTLLKEMSQGRGDHHAAQRVVLLAKNLDRVLDKDEMKDSIMRSEQRLWRTIDIKYDDLVTNPESKSKSKYKDIVFKSTKDVIKRSLKYQLPSTFFPGQSGYHKLNLPLNIKSGSLSILRGANPKVTTFVQLVSVHNLGLMRDKYIKKYPEVLDWFNIRQNDYNPIMLYLIKKSKKYETERERNEMLDMARKMWQGDTHMVRESFVQSFMRNSGWVGEFKKEVEMDPPPARLQVLF